MAIHKNILISLLLILLIFLMCSCNNITKVVYQQTEVVNEVDYIDFPKDIQGYPKRELVIINGNIYSLENIEKPQTLSEIEIKIEEDNNIEVVLPQYLPTYFWSIEESENIDLISYTKNEQPVQYAVEGKSANLQIFTFNTLVDDSILLKWSNINELGKSFTDKKEEYLLKIKIVK